MEDDTDRRAVVVEREFAHPPERLWRALTQPHLIQEWLMRNDFVPKVGHHFSLTGDWGGVLDCEVLEIDPGRMLSYTWNFASADPAFALRSVVTFTLTDIVGGSRLRVEQAGFRPDQKQAFGGARVGWANFLDRLDLALGRHDRATLKHHHDKRAP